MGIEGGVTLKFKKYMMGSVVVMGIAGAFIGMIPHEKSVSAAVMVYDQQNIEEAIKTAISTADILTNAQKQLALQVLDMTKMTDGKATQYLNGMQKEQNYPLDEKDAQIGALKTNSSVQTFWDEKFPDIDSILSGKTTVMDAYYASQKSMQAMEQTNEDALGMAKTTQTMADNVAASTMEALNNSTNAQGNLEAQQANTQVNAAGVMALVHGNNLLSNMGAAQAVKYQRELQDEVIARSIMEQSVTKLDAAVANCDPQPVSWEDSMSKMGESY